MGAPYEGGPLERALWRVLGRRKGRRRWTDDTQMSLDVLNSLLDQGKVNPEDLARRFSASYHWSRGYGPGAAKVLKRIRSGQPWQQARISVYPDGSYGNGGAMRVLPVALYFPDATASDLRTATESVAAITHAHPLALEAAFLMAWSGQALLWGKTDQELLLGLRRELREEAYLERLERLEALCTQHMVSPSDVAKQLGNGMAAVDSVVTALYVAIRFRESEYQALIHFCCAMRGDVDTLASMSGGLWGAARGVEDLPADWLEELEDRERIDQLARELVQRRTLPLELFSAQ